MLFFTLAVIFPLSMLPRMRHVSGAGTVGWYATCAARLASRLVCCVCGTAGQQASLPRVQQGWPGQRWLHAAHRRRRAADPDAVHGQSSALTASHLSLSALRTLLFFLTSLTQLEMVGNCGIFILLALAGGCLAAKACTRLVIEVCPLCARRSQQQSSCWCLVRCACRPACAGRHVVCICKELTDGAEASREPAMQLSPAWSMQRG